MEGLLPEIQILLTLSKETKPLRFKEIVKKTQLSTATVSKWLKIHEASGLIRKTRDGYEITEGGVGYLKGIMTRIVSEAIDAGVVEAITLYVGDDVVITRNPDNEYELHLTGYGEREFKVIVNIGDTTDLLDKLCRKHASTR